MAAGLAAGYGAFAYVAGKFLYPMESRSKAWMFVCQASTIRAGKSLKYRTPAGATVNIARAGETDVVESFVALSSTCPHLGCQVHWEPQNDRFFCPCHNGVFTPSGKAIEGPPAEADQSLPQYELRVAGGLLYILVETSQLADAGIIEEPRYPRGSGHDPCLAPPHSKAC
jgi:Rieske Fe-S protein